MSQKSRKHDERRQVSMGIDHHTHPWYTPTARTSRPELKPTVGIGSAQITTKNNIVRLLDSFVDVDPQTKPRMPWVQ